ncbi:hypothetical protein P154DRAFT_193549 [Amniculicola lignicola CBS 123094]|uniref:Uncharacterized protein n=1 Tax=Amniculicola lignicola CBS 123094 TaxID=1392246 RepID=A0A6A5WIG6_9PLEO|nr:hypothetical protein P154DRAFT_193549 [Amniculicola lignicola CBS 123094]
MKDVVQNVLVTATLVHTLMECFGSASEIYRKLKKKKRKLEQELGEDFGLKKPLQKRSTSRFRAEYEYEGTDDLRHRRRSKSRRRDDDGDDSDAESIYSSGPHVRAEYDRGYHYLGEKFAVGDLLAQNQLQSQIILMQQAIISAYQNCNKKHGYHSVDLERHLAELLKTARRTRAASIEALDKQYWRLHDGRELRETKEVVVRPRSHSRGRSVYLGSTTSEGPTKTHDLVVRTRSKSRGRESIHGSVSSRRADPLFCIYARDLQDYADQRLCDSYQPDGDGSCPYCRCHIYFKPTKAWQVVKEDGRGERSFLVENRFIVKCHREGGGFACALCRRFGDVDTACEDVGSLVDHVWREHEIGELIKEEDILEID